MQGTSPGGVDLAAINAAATQLVGWAQAHGGDPAGTFDELHKVVDDANGRSELRIPQLDIGVPLPPVDPKRHRPVARLHAQRSYRGLSRTFWTFAAANDPLLTVAVTRLDDEGFWATYVAKGPLRQFVDRFPVPSAGGGIAMSAAPLAAPYALAIADVLLPWQDAVQKLAGPRKKAPHWDPEAAL